MKLNKKQIKNKKKKLKGIYNPISLFDTAVYRWKNKKAIFPYYGIQAYMGEFGGGKTISAVKEAKEILQNYPKAMFISNTIIDGVGNETHYFRKCR